MSKDTQLVNCLNCFTIQRIVKDNSYIPECFQCQSNALEEIEIEKAIEITRWKMTSIAEGNARAKENIEAKDNE